MKNKYPYYYFWSFLGTFIGALVVLILWKQIGEAWSSKLVLPVIIILFVASIALFILFLYTQLTHRVFEQSVFSVMALVGILAILVSINYIASRHYKRIDLTSNKRYSLSDQTKKVIKDIREELFIYAFFPTASPKRGNVEDLIKEYTQISPKIHFEFIDPIKNLAKAREYGVMREETIVMTYKDRRENVTNDFNEEALTNTILKIISERQKVIYFLGGHGEESLEKGYSQVNEALKNENYQIKTLLLMETLKIPPDCDILIIGGPKMNLVDKEINLIRQYVEERGGKLMVLLNTNPISSLENLLLPWGVKANQDIIIDVSGIGQYLGLGPGIAIASQYAEHPITKDFHNIATIFPLARSFTLMPAKEGIVTNLTELIKTTPGTYSYRGKFPPKGGKLKLDKSRDIPGPHTVVVAGTVKVNPQNYKGTLPQQEGRIVIIGSALLCENTYFTQQGNLDFFLNAINWLASEEKLISIRPKNPSIQRLTLTGPIKIGLNVLVIFLPVLILISGIIVWWRRR